MAKLNKISYPLLAILLLVVASALVFNIDFFTRQYTQAPSTESANRLTPSLNSNPISLGQQVVADYVIHFPADHGEHTLFDIEWWYLTANLEDEQGQLYGIQWTLFRFRNPTQIMTDTHWSNNQLYMAHASINSVDSHWFSEKFARGEVGNAGLKSKPLQLYIDDWSWLNTANEPLESQNLLPADLSFYAERIITQHGQDNAVLQVSLALQQQGPFVLQGENGYSIKSGDGTYASHYYSNPFIDIKGQFTFMTDHRETSQSRSINVKGQAWFDHEWTSKLVDSQTLGWDWLSIHLDDGSKLMAFRMRIAGKPDFITGTLAQADGSQTLLTRENLILTPTQWIKVKQQNLPLSWQVKIPQFNIDIAVRTLKNDQWNPALIAYYEGMVGVSGSHTGKGFLELTGY